MRRVAIAVVWFLVCGVAVGEEFAFETARLRFVIGSDGMVKSFVDKKDNSELLRQTKPSYVTAVRIARDGESEVILPASAARSGDTVAVRFTERSVSVVLRFAPLRDFLLVELVDVKGEGGDGHPD